MWFAIQDVVFQVRETLGPFVGETLKVYLVSIAVLGAVARLVFRGPDRESMHRGLAGCVRAFFVVLGLMVLAGVVAAVGGAVWMQSDSYESWKHESVFCASVVGAILTPLTLRISSAFVGFLPRRAAVPAEAP